MARRRQSNVEAFSGINITPLMDLTFLLLIVFMIAAPMLEYTVNVSPPKMNAETPEVEDSILLNLDADGNIILDRSEITREQLSARLVDVQRSRPDIPVLIRAHEERPYGEVIELMKIVRSAELTNVSLVTQAED